MYTQLARNVHVTNKAQVSQAVSMEGANAIVFTATVMEYTAGTLTIQLQVSNDLENWIDMLGASRTYTAVGYGKNKVTDISDAYVRLKYSFATDENAIVSAGINTADL